MSSPYFSLEQMARLRDSARRLEVQAAEYEETLATLLATSGTHPDVASSLRLAARQHHVAASRLVLDLGHRRDRPDGELSLRHAVLVVRRLPGQS